jgi:hypothetical protein
MHLLHIPDMKGGGQRFTTHMLQGRDNVWIKADLETRRMRVNFSRFASALLYLTSRAGHPAVHVLQPVG